MKKNLLTYILLIIAAITMASCSDDPAPQYTYFKPCTNWQATTADVRAYMATAGGWTETLAQGNTMMFKNEGTQTAIIYAFHDGKLSAAVVTVSGFNTRYGDYKASIADNYGIEFKSSTMLDYGINPKIMTAVLMHRFSTYMTAAYIDINFLQLLEIDPADIATIQAPIEKIKAGLL